VWAKEHLSIEDVKNELLFATNDKGKTTWHVAAKKGNLLILQQIGDWAKENATKEEVNNKLLFARDKKGRTSYQVARDHGNFELLQEILN